MHDGMHDGYAFCCTLLAAIATVESVKWTARAGILSSAFARKLMHIGAFSPSRVCFGWLLQLTA